jgi:hypothetical protein
VYSNALLVQISGKGFEERFGQLVRGSHSICESSTRALREKADTGLDGTFIAVSVIRVIGIEGYLLRGGGRVLTIHAQGRILHARHLTNRWSARVEDKVPSSCISARGAQLNR